MKEASKELVGVNNSAENASPPWDCTDMDEVGRLWVTLPAYRRFGKDNTEIMRDRAKNELKMNGRKGLREGKK